MGRTVEEDGVVRTPSGNGLTVRLPAPTGPNPVGSTTLHLVDRSRRDPWSPVLVREVMATVFYPAAAVAGHPVAPHMTRAAAASFRVSAPRTHPQLPTAGVDWAATRTHAHAQAPAQAVRRPVLLHSPGGGDPRTLGTAVAEELAGRGWVVVSVDHPGDAGEVAFPGGGAGRPEELRETVFRGDPRLDPELFRTAIDTRVADLRFVLGEVERLAAGENPDVEGRPLPEGLHRALDVRRAGVYGHSAGGTAAAQALHEDRRFHTAVNLEGFLDHPPSVPGGTSELFPVARYGVDRPLLLMGTDGFPGRPELTRSWSAALAHPGSPVRLRQLDGAAHWVFSDYAAIAPQLRAAGLMTDAERVALTGTIGAGAAVRAVREAVHGFFARHLPWEGCGTGRRESLRR
ncbi:alpha/beta hydrolase [Streptomyces sp. NPDC001985]|uniref:alpha/beta hydrolase n=1 Tax=Streptomyces sp. NPDC001985 TaxID=3154406 RepID=UPI0033337D82